MSRREQKVQVEMLRLLCPQVVADSQAFNATNHLVDSSESQLSHDGSQLIGHIVEEVDDVLRSSLELLAQLWVLSSNTDRLFNDFS
jgi:hypothetical protein